MEKQLQKIVKKHFDKFLDEAGKEVFEAVKGKGYASLISGGQFSIKDAESLAAVQIIPRAQNMDPYGDYDGENRYFPLQKADDLDN